jgi:asparagine synthase (glutamine-hydrolysing)
MCGLTGFLEPYQSFDAQQAESTLLKMSRVISHRGPDDQGVWIDPQACIALGHRRLSIIDISSQGHQPMHSACGRYVITYNGEIYNYLEIKTELEGLSAAPLWRGHSDTEVILAAITHWGLENALKKFTGMFALALWDKKERVLQLARDRLGEKPLYYGWMGNVLLFGSELKSLRMHPAWKGEINPDTLALFIQHCYVPAPYSIYKNIYKVQQGTIATFDSKNILPSSQPLKSSYWPANELAESGIRKPFQGSESEAIENLEKLLQQSVKQQMIADVPLGACLSGGIDSSTIVAIMQQQSQTPVKTFTMGFSEEAYNEAQYAKEVAKHLGTDHTELYITPREAMEVIPKLSQIYDEPFSDSSQIPTYLISQLTRSKVTVSLSGDGGDELFGGYNRYFQGRTLWNYLKLIPDNLQEVLQSTITSISPLTWDTLGKWFAPVLPEKAKQPNFGNKLHKLAEILNSKDPDGMYLKLVSIWQESSSIVKNSKQSKTFILNSRTRPNIEDFTQRMMFLDAMTYLPDDILVKVDRASMAVSLETRVPFLDHKIVEFAWQTPLHMKIRNGQGKWLLRQVLHKYIPQDMIERPKMGFGVPIDSWLRGPLKDWAENLLSENKLRNEGFFNPVPIREKWMEHQAGKKNWHHHIWTILMFQSWLETQNQN